MLMWRDKTGLGILKGMKNSYRWSFMKHAFSLPQIGGSCYIAGRVNFFLTYKKDA
jgi:hypothetical protein